MKYISVSLEEPEASEIQVDGVWYAITEDDSVFKQTGDCSERDDGYQFIFKLEVEEYPEDWQAFVASEIRKHNEQQ